MTITAQWDNPEKTIVRQKFQGKWTGAEYSASIDEITNILKGIDYDVHWIGDMTDSVGIPVLNLLSVSGRVVKLIDRPVATITVVHAHNYFQSLVNVVRRMSPALAERVYFVKTLDEAYSRLTKQSDMTELKVS